MYAEYVRDQKLQDGGTKRHINLLMVISVVERTRVSNSMFISEVSDKKCPGGIYFWAVVTFEGIGSSSIIEKFIEFCDIKKFFQHKSEILSETVMKLMKMKFVLLILNITSPHYLLKVFSTPPFSLKSISLMASIDIIDRQIRMLCPTSGSF